ncbi:MAG TPA: hypothetical protein VND22_09095 [Actinomycetota bacterium]|nr:hypothetical protein [Actinomycetota bacterium]
MMKFLVGVLAAVLWAGTLVGLFVIFKSSPKHPFQSIKEFRLARGRLSRPSGPLVEVVNEASLAEPPVFVEQRRRPQPEPEPEPARALEEFEPALQDDLDPEGPVDVEGLWDYEEGPGPEAEEEEWDDEGIDEEEEEEEEDSGTYDQDEYDEDEPYEDDEELPEEEEEEEGSSSLDIILVDDFGKPAR